MEEVISREIKMEPPVMSPPTSKAAHLTPEQQEAFATMKKNLADITDLEEKAWVDDDCILRYLRARDYDVSKSEPLLRDTIKWRFHEYKPHRSHPSVIKSEAESGKNYVSPGKDKKGRPILYMRPRRDNTHEYKVGLKLLTNNMERCIDKMEGGVEQWVWIVDYGGTMKGSPPIGTGLETLTILSNHYPERLGHAFLIDPPFLFSVFWKALYPFIPTVTQQKVHFIKGSAKEKAKQLSEWFDLDQIETEIGGSLNFEWDFNRWYKEEEAAYEAREKHRADVYGGNPPDSDRKSIEVQISPSSS